MKKTRNDFLIIEAKNEGRTEGSGIEERFRYEVSPGSHSELRRALKGED